jgi:hypothetical protein
MMDVKLSGLQGIDSNIRHEAVPVPPGHCPFDQDTLVVFEHGFNILTEGGELPSGYGVTLDELDGNAFNEQEKINIGRNRAEHAIILPSEIWKPRTELWAQGLYAMTSILSLSV